MALEFHDGNILISNNNFGSWSLNTKYIFHLFLFSTKVKFKLPCLKIKVTTSGFGLSTKKVKNEIIEFPSSVITADIQSVFYFQILFV